MGMVQSIPNLSNFRINRNFIGRRKPCWSLVGRRAVSGVIQWIRYRTMYANRHIYTCIFAVGVFRIPQITAAVSAGLPRDLHSRGGSIPNKPGLYGPLPMLYRIQVSSTGRGRVYSSFLMPKTTLVPFQRNTGSASGVNHEQFLASSGHQSLRII